MSTKLHVGLSEGYLCGACLSEGQRTDMKVFPKLWKAGNWEPFKYVVADKGYDYYDVHSVLREADKIPVIPRRRNALFPGVQDKERYATRSAIERFFGHIKENKRMFARYDKLEHTFFAFFALAAMKTLKLLC